MSAPVRCLGRIGICHTQSTEVEKMRSLTGLSVVYSSTQKFSNDDWGRAVVSVCRSSSRAVESVARTSCVLRTRRSFSPPWHVAVMAFLPLVASTTTDAVRLSSPLRTNDHG